MAHVEDIYIAEKGSAPMSRVESVHALARAGLDGDRYMKRTGYWTDVDECQVTLIEGEALDEIRASGKVHIDNGQHRRNIVTRGISLDTLAGKRFKVGEALFEFDRPRPPCRYIQSVSERGMTRALGGRRGGICARVIESGTVRAGDRIEVKESTPEQEGGFWLKAPGR
jgi:MOSC domain-containing protein YiiM